MYNMDSSRNRFQGHAEQDFNKNLDYINKIVPKKNHFMQQMVYNLRQSCHEEAASELQECIRTMLFMQSALNGNFKDEEVGRSSSRDLKFLRNDLAYKDETISGMKEHNQNLADRNNELTHQVEELTNRISQMMSSQEKDRKDAHENIMDENRPSAIVDRFRSLYTQLYGEIAAELQDVNCIEQSIAESLLKIVMMAMRKTKEKVERSKEEIISKLKVIFSESPFKKIGNKRTLSKHLLDDVCMMLRTAPDRSMFDGIQKRILDSCKSIVASGGPAIERHLINYVNECVEVTWLMNASNPPMFLAYDKSVDAKYSPERHSKYSGSGSMIEYFLWPCVYFSEDVHQKNGNVMAKGEVALKRIDKKKDTKVTRNEPKQIMKERSAYTGYDVKDMQGHGPGYAIPVSTGNSVTQREDGGKVSSKDDPYGQTSSGIRGEDDRKPESNTKELKTLYSTAPNVPAGYTTLPPISPITSSSAVERHEKTTILNRVILDTPYATGYTSKQNPQEIPKIYESYQDADMESPGRMKEPYEVINPSEFMLGKSDQENVPISEKLAGDVLKMEEWDQFRKQYTGTEKDETNLGAPGKIRSPASTSGASNVQTITVNTNCLYHRTGIFSSGSNKYKQSSSCPSSSCTCNTGKKR